MTWRLLGRCAAESCARQSSARDGGSRAPIRQEEEEDDDEAEEEKEEKEEKEEGEEENGRWAVIKIHEAGRHAYQKPHACRP